MSQTTKQIVIIGDGTVGKTCLLHSYSNERFLEDYVPTVYDKEVFDLSINEEVHTIKLIDTAGQEEYGRLRRLFYKEADSFILCYDISSRTSFRNIEQKWMPELTTLDRWPIPVILVATKTDLRHNSRKPLISTEEGEDLCRAIRANRFIECSAKENIQIENTIHEAVRAAVKGPVVVEEEKEKQETFCSCCQS